MNRALIWKEWRENRALVLAGWAVSAAMPLLVLAGSAAGNVSGVRNLAATTLVSSMFLIWPLFAAVAGAGTLAGEAGGRTAGFLLSRPVSRLRVWALKVAVAGGALGAVVLGSVVVVTLVGAGSATGIAAAIGGGARLMGGAFQQAFAGSGLLLVFAAAVFTSAFVARPLTAAVLALALASLLVGELSLLVTTLQVPYPMVFHLILVLLAAVLLVASLRVFRRAGAGNDVGPGVALAVLAPLVLVVPALVLTPLAWSQATLDPASAWLGHVGVAGEGRSLFLGLTTSGYARQIWRVDAAGGSPERVTALLRPAWSPAPSPDGRWLVYRSQSGWLGIAGATEVRLASRDGVDRVLWPSLPMGPDGVDQPPVERLGRRRSYVGAVGYPRWSPDGRWVALGVEGNTLVAALDVASGSRPAGTGRVESEATGCASPGPEPMGRGRPDARPVASGPMVRLLSAAPGTVLVPLGWSAAGDRLHLWRALPPGQQIRQRFESYDPVAGTLEILHEERRTGLLAGYVPESGERSAAVLLRLEEGGEESLEVLDLGSGAVVSRWPVTWDRSGLGRDGTTLYALRELEAEPAGDEGDGSGAGEPTASTGSAQAAGSASAYVTEITALDLVGSGIRWTYRLEGRVITLRPPPTLDLPLVIGARISGAPRTGYWLLGPGGRERLPVDGFVEGWVGDRLYVEEFARGRITLVDPATLEQQVVFR